MNRSLAIAAPLAALAALAALAPRPARAQAPGQTPPADEPAVAEVPATDRAAEPAEPAGPTPDDSADEPAVTIFAVSGRAEGRGDHARIAALDRAFASAVEQALDRVVDAPLRTARRDRLATEVVRHARLYVASFKVHDERVIDGETRVEITARVKTAALRQAVEGLGLLAPLANNSNGGGPRPKLVILLAQASPDGQKTSFGSTGTDELDALKALASSLRERGFDLVSAAGTRVTRATTSEEADGAVLGDAAALDLARQLGAGAALVVGIQATADGRIRGTAFVGARSRGAARLLEAASGQTIATADASEAGWGDDLAAASERASLIAADALAPIISRAAARQWPAPLSGSSAGRVGVVIKKADSWAPIAAMIRQLAVTKGIDAVHPREIRGSSVTIDVETALPAKEIARAIHKTRLPVGASLSAKVSGSGVTVVVR